MPLSNISNDTIVPHTIYYSYRLTEYDLLKDYTDQYWAEVAVDGLMNKLLAYTDVDLVVDSDSKRYVATISLRKVENSSVKGLEEELSYSNTQRTMLQNELLKLKKSIENYNSLPWYKKVLKKI